MREPETWDMQETDFPRLSFCNTYTLNLLIELNRGNRRRMRVQYDTYRSNYQAGITETGVHRNLVDQGIELQSV